MLVKINHRFQTGGLGICILSLCLLLGIATPASALLPFENTGNLYVSMWSANEIAVFTPEGSPVERFSADGLDGPRGIAFNPANGEIWVAGEHSNAIYIFDHNHQFLRVLEHPDFDEPVGVTFSNIVGGDAEDPLVYISNSNGNELIVFDQQGNLLRRFTDPTMQDPNCSAFMNDGSLFVANRLGGTTGSIGSIATFNANEEFQFDFTASGIQSVMAVARDSNISPDDFDDTVWVTSGGGDMGIYEFDQTGNLLTALLPADIDDGSAIVPQGIAFDDNGDFYVVSFRNEVLKFDSAGNFIMRFPTGDGSSRSTAFQACQVGTGSETCIPLGIDSVTTDDNPGKKNQQTNNDANSSSSGGGAGQLMLVSLLLFLLLRRSYLRSYATCTLSSQSRLH